eukprot:5606313-Pleurochrysis_carterae.AAC.4
MAVLQHGSDASKDEALDRLGDLALGTASEGPQQAALFRSAVISSGVIPALVSLLGSTEPRRQYLTAVALHKLAIDDPTTELDNTHSLEICQGGAVGPLVKLLASKEARLAAILNAG